MTPQDPQSLTVTTPEGYEIDLGPLAHSACQARRNTLLAAVNEQGLPASPPVIAATILGMQVAVEMICGKDAAATFDAAVNRPLAGND